MGHSSIMMNQLGGPLAPNPDPDLPGEDLDYDLLGFDERDELDALAAQDFRELLTGLPARPGTKR